MINPMKRIDVTLKKWLQSNKNFQEDYAKLKAEILQDPSVRQFLAKHNFLSEEIIDRNLNTLHEYVSQSKHCVNCQSLEQCNNVLQGYYPVLRAEDETIQLSYVKCDRRILAEKNRRQRELIKSLYMPVEALQATYDDID